MNVELALSKKNFGISKTIEFVIKKSLVGILFSFNLSYI